MGLKPMRVNPEKGRDSLFSDGHGTCAGASAVAVTKADVLPLVSGACHYRADCYFSIRRTRA